LDVRLAAAEQPQLSALPTRSRRWSELFDLADLGRWHAREQIFEVIKRVESVPCGKIVLG
jgi:hypothetical protein